MRNSCDKFLILAWPTHLVGMQVISPRGREDSNR